MITTPKNKLIVNRLRLQEGNQKFSQELTSEELEIKNLMISGLINVDLNLQKNGKSVIVTGFVKFRASLCCANCLVNYDKDFCEDVYQEYVQGVNPIINAHGRLEDVDLLREYYSGDSFDLTSLIRDTVQLAIPLAPWCREDCPGVV